MSVLNLSCMDSWNLSDELCLSQRCKKVFISSLIYLTLEMLTQSIFYIGYQTLLPVRCRKHFPVPSFLRSWLITEFLTRYTRRMPLVEQELLSLPEFTQVFGGVCVTRSGLVLCVCFVDCCLSFCRFSFGHCVVCSSLIYRFRLPLWYLQTLLIPVTISPWQEVCHSM